MEHSDTGARPCALWRATPAPAGFCSRWCRAGTLASVSNAAESETSVIENAIRSAEARRELFCVGFMGSWAEVWNISINAQEASVRLAVSAGLDVLRFGCVDEPFAHG